MGLDESSKRRKGNRQLSGGNASMISDNLHIAYSIYQALQIYSKSCPEETFESIGKKMRDENFNIHLIALVGHH